MLCKNCMEVLYIFFKHYIWVHQILNAQGLKGAYLLEPNCLHPSTKKDSVAKKADNILYGSNLSTEYLFY